MKNINKTLMQYFEWYLKPEDNLWNKVVLEAGFLSSIGITDLWLPPAYKGSGGQYDTGYGVYDLYDLGEFDQKGSVRTKYGTKQEYLEAIKVLHGNNIRAIADIVFNHKLGSDGTEDVIAIEQDPFNRNNSMGEPRTIRAWTKYDFPGRNNKYSDFKWNWTHFHGVDYDELTQKKSIYQFYGKHWDSDVDKENGNFDYLMGTDVDFNNMEVIEHLNSWAKWYLNETNIDGFRLDAVKHIHAEFVRNFLNTLRKETEEELFSFGEYWSGNLDSLKEYLNKTNNELSLFDVPLHYNFFNASNSNGYYDMRTILDGSLTKSIPDMSISFVDNHDTELGQSLESWVQPWFKPLAYAIILLRNAGTPCIFYGDFYGIPEKNFGGLKNLLQKLITARKYFAYGSQTDYFNDNNIIGWTRSGDFDHPDSGMAVIMSDGHSGSKVMNVGKRLANCILYDITGNLNETVYVDKEGNGIFYTDGGSVSVWVKKDNMYNNKD